MKNLCWQIAQTELVVNNVQFNSLWNDKYAHGFF